MRWSVLTSCMYLETFAEMLAPAHETIDGGEVVVFKAPVGGELRRSFTCRIWGSMRDG
jgi:hypothetical protein